MPNGRQESMSARGVKAGFSLIEALVALVITGVGIAGILGAFGSTQRSEALSLRAEKMQRLAKAKLDEILATRDFNTESGDFSLDGEPNFVWSMTDETTPVTDLDNVTVRVELADNADVWRTASMLTYKAPNSSGSASP